ncbi:MAG: hypothetical protein KAS32_14615 [Candidatus Peribacteraceae bacterium]|nr:hypothetical protein [Candidatus Peribacteraceae bacterium]
MSIIKDGTGTGKNAQVTEKNQLSVKSESESIQHSQSFNEEQAYQVRGNTNLASAAVTVLHIENTSSTRSIVVTYIRHQVIAASGGTEFPNVSNYLAIGFGTTYDSGGSVCTPINMNNGSGHTAEVISYCGAPTVTGTFTEFDRWYTKADGDMNTYNKEGSVIIQPNQTFEVRYIGDHSSGIISTRVSFIMKEN